MAHPLPITEELCRLMVVTWLTTTLDGKGENALQVERMTS